MVEQVIRRTKGRCLAVHQVPDRAGAASDYGRRRPATSPYESRPYHESALQSRWAKIPEFRVAYDQILASPQSTATAGPVSGAQAQVDDAVQDGLTSISNGARLRSLP